MGYDVTTYSVQTQLSFTPREKASMKRIRSHATRSVVHHPWNSTQMEIGAKEVHDDLTRDGIQTSETNHLVLLSCGHLATEPFSLCSACECMVCTICSHICHTCARPIGRCHSIEKDGKWYCKECRAAQKRTSLWRIIVSPIIRFTGEK